MCKKNDVVQLKECLDKYQNKNLSVFGSVKQYIAQKVYDRSDLAGLVDKCL